MQALEYSSPWRPVGRFLWAPTAVEYPEGEVCFQSRPILRRKEAHLFFSISFFFQKDKYYVTITSSRKELTYDAQLSLR